jgi:hypothetical protein
MYPIDKVMAVGAGNMLQFLKHINVVSEIVGINYSGKVDATLLSEYQYLFENEAKYRIGSTTPKVEKVAMQNVHASTGAATLIVGDDYTYVQGKAGDDKNLRESDIEDLGIDVIRVAHTTTDMSKFVSDLALIQFFLCKSTNLVALQDWIKDTLTELNDKLNENVGEGKKYSVVKFANSSYSTYTKNSDGTIKTSDAISKDGSDYTAFGYAAGGAFALKGATSFASQGNGGSWLNDYEIDKIVVTATGNGYSWYGGTADEEGKGLEKVTERIMAYYLSEPFYNEEVYVLSGDMPVLMRIIYCAHIYYPQLFSKEWADNINKDYTSTYFGLNSKQIENGNYFFSMKDLNIEGH